MTQVVWVCKSDYRDILRFDDEGGGAVDVVYEVLPEPIEIKPRTNPEKANKKSKTAGQESS